MLVEVTNKVPAETAELWDLLTGRRCAARWLGTDGRDAVLLGTAITLAHRPGDRGTVAGIDEQGHRIAITFASGGAACVSLTATDGGTTVSVVEEPVPDELAAQVRAAWRSALATLWLTWSDASDAREPRQAVVLIHGMGEQLPGATARAFADALFGAGRYFSKPDRVSESYELRRLQVERDVGAGLPRTDVFELYWGDRVRDTTLAQVWEWLWALVRRPRSAVSAGMRGIWLLTRVLAALVVLTVVLLVVVLGIDGLTALWTGIGTVAKLWYVSLALTVVIGAATGWLVHVLGDAVRYLSPRPGNIAVRTSIRDAGIHLLRRLHADPRYHRVVVVGHSIGSVVGYDVLLHYWSEVHARHGHPVVPDRAALKAYDEEAGAVAGLDQQALQAQLWSGLRANGVPWLVTDFVTLGSPLAHAGTLLAESPAELDELRRARVLASCPPQPDPKTGTYTFSRKYLSTNGSPSMPVLHHAALFGPTRWTNMYAPVRGAILGDFVGGPVAAAFGVGVVDVEVVHRSPWLRWTPAAHSAFWHADVVGLLKAAVRLDAHAVLAAAARPLDEYVPEQPGEPSAVQR